MYFSDVSSLLSCPFFVLADAWHNILVFAKTAPLLFAPYCEDFFICASDAYQTRALNLEILTTIDCPRVIYSSHFEEFQVFCTCNVSYISWAIRMTCNVIWWFSRKSLWYKFCWGNKSSCILAFSVSYWRWFMHCKYTCIIFPGCYKQFFCT